MQDLARATRIPPGSKVDLDAHPPDARLGLRGETTARERTAKRAKRMADLATMLMAEHKRAVLVVLQGMDASGKDGTVKHCLGGLNPMSVRVAGFKAPNSTELAHDFLWRIHQVLPQRGEIGIFNRSHYEDVLVVRVHELVPKKLWQARFGHITGFEALLAEQGTIVLKYFLHITKKEQKERLLEREKDPATAWKLNPNDWKERDYWDEYTGAYEDAISRTAAKHAPWIVVPANAKWYRNLVIAESIVEALRAHRKGWHRKLKEMAGEAKASLAAYRKK